LRSAKDFGARPGRKPGSFSPPARAGTAMQKPAAAGDSALGTARRPPAPHTCIGAQQQSHVARRRGRAQPDGRGAPQAAPAARPPWEWPGRRPGAGRGGFFTNCRILVLPPTIGEHANDPRAFSLWGWRERSEQPAPKGKRKGVVCVRAKGGGKTRKRQLVKKPPRRGVFAARQARAPKNWKKDLLNGKIHYPIFPTRPSMTTLL